MTENVGTVAVAAAVANLRIVDRAGRIIVDDLSFDVRSGDALGIVGESGSGKTTTALALLGWVRPGLTIVSGSIRFGDVEIVGASESAARRVRGRVVAYVPQAPAAALSPLMRVGAQVAEATFDLAPDARRRRVYETYEMVQLPTDSAFLRRFPHQLSGGQQQRVGLAIALANRPRVVVLDEPTTGLDVITQDSVLASVDRLCRELSIGIVSISHDLALVAKYTDRLLVMNEGRVVESGPSRVVLSSPSAEYTRTLVASVPDHHATMPTRTAAAPTGVDPREPAQASVLSVVDLVTSHVSRGRRVIATDAISFRLERGRCLAIVGQSGSGKTTLARAVAGLHRPDSGHIQLNGDPLPVRAKDRDAMELRSIQLIFQDPFASLNPRSRIGDSIARPLRKLRGMSRAAALEEVTRLLERVRVKPSLMSAYPAELSGGECQRVAIARALSTAPELLICDEITSALDVSVQASVLQLLAELRRDLGLAMLFISHDLGVVHAVAETVMVVENGVCREYGPVGEVLQAPKDGYTRRLVAAAPSLSDSLRDDRPGPPGPRATEPQSEAI